MDPTQIVTVLLGGSGVVGVGLSGFFKVRADRLAAEVQKHKDDNEALKAQVAAQATAGASVEVTREQEETHREVAADQIDIERGERSLDRIRETQAWMDLLMRQQAKLYASAVHAWDVAGELARGYPPELRADNPLVQQFLHGVVPTEELVPRLVEPPSDMVHWDTPDGAVREPVSIVHSPAIVLPEVNPPAETNPANPQPPVGPRPAH